MAWDPGSIGLNLELGKPEEMIVVAEQEHGVCFRCCGVQLYIPKLSDRGCGGRRGFLLLCLSVGS